MRPTCQISYKSYLIRINLKCEISLPRLNCSNYLILLRETLNFCNKGFFLWNRKRFKIEIKEDTYTKRNLCSQFGHHPSYQCYPSPDSSFQLRLILLSFYSFLFFSFSKDSYKKHVRHKKIPSIGLIVWNLEEQPPLPSPQGRQSYKVRLWKNSLRQNAQLLDKKLITSQTFYLHYFNVYQGSCQREKQETDTFRDQI